MLLNLLESGLEGRVESLVCAPPSPYLLEYTGTKAIDKILCALVGLLDVSLNPPASGSQAYFAATCVLPFITFIGLEACRKGSHYSISYPGIFAQTMQFASYGVMVPIYWLLFFLTGAAWRSKGSAVISRGDAGSIIFGLWAGWGLMTAFMVARRDPYITAVWYGVPLWASVAQRLHLAVVPAPQSGYSFIRALYIACFLIASWMHVTTLFTLWGDAEALKSFFVPSVFPLGDLAPLELLLRDIAQWDTLIGIISSVIATLFFAKSRRQLIGLFAWHAAVIPVLGPGAAFIGAALWRESGLSGATEEAKEKTSRF